MTVVHLLVEKLDASTRLLWESSLNSTQEFPRFGELTEFLQNRVLALEAAGSKQRLNAIGSPTPSKKHQRRSDVYVHATAASPKSWDSQSSCPLCREQHALRACAKFKAYPVEQRRDCIRKRRACFNCLGSDHNASSCPSANRCRQCQSKHHTLLHFKDDSTAKTTAMADGTPDHEDGIMTPESTTTALNSTISVLSSSTRGCVLLATARVMLMGESGRSVNVRALLDSGSEAFFVSERAAQLLKLPRRRMRVAVSGLQGAVTGTALHAVSVMIGTHRSPSLRTAVPRALMLPKLTFLIPGHRFAVRKWPHLDGLDLADPEFAVPAAVDCVLGADIYGLLCESGRRIGPPGSPSAHQTIFGWVLMGPVSDIRPKSYTSVSSLHITTLTDLNQDLQRFWKLDEVPEGRILTPEEKACEDLFVRTHTLNGTGRYIMRLPRKEDPSNLLGTSRLGAFRLLQSNERRLGRDQTLRHRYREFMSSYISLGHMEVIPRRDNQSAESFYMPHHAVIKHSDSSDKIRVVFNASYRSSSGVSLNDLLVSELWLVLTRWRMSQFAFSTDIVKMFRQIRIHPDDADLQRVLWRAEPEAEVRDFRLTTVTYGTAPAPYLAIRILLQLAQNEGDRFPLGANALQSHTYVDDVLAGAVLFNGRPRDEAADHGPPRRRRFPSQQNHDDLAPAGNPEDCLVSDRAAISTLGVLWSTQADTLALSAIPTLASLATCTKRMILSDVAKFFDPLGWAAPVIIVAKIYIQDLWKASLDWDQSLPDELRQKWVRYASDLPTLDGLRIPRWTGSTKEGPFQLHRFSDVSSRAYAASVYLRSSAPRGDPIVRLIAARTRVAPIKPVSIPRLELCGALLLARLLTAIARGLGLQNDAMHAWSDAKVALA